MPTFTDAVVAAAPAGYYITQQDLEDRYGEQNIIAWSNQEGASATSVLVSRVNDSILWAEGHLHDLFRNRRYALPLPISTTVKGWCERLAAWDLATWRGTREDNPIAEKVAGLKDAAEAEVSRVLLGIRSIDAEWSEAGPTAPQVLLG